MLKAEVAATTCLIGERCWYTWLADGGVNEAAGAHCASSMDPSQKNSPFYKLACDDDIYMFATTGLHGLSLQPLERRHAGVPTRLGRVGHGPSARHRAQHARYQSGQVGRRLHSQREKTLAPVHYTGGNAGNLKPGAIYAIDVRTGNRRVLSGSYLGPNGRVDVGSGHTVQGEALPFLTEIKLGADGMIYGLGSNTLTHVEITSTRRAERERSSGGANRSQRQATPPSRTGSASTGRVSPNYAGGFEPVQYAALLALQPNGTSTWGGTTTASVSCRSRATARTAPTSRAGRPETSRPRSPTSALASRLNMEPSVA